MRNNPALYLQPIAKTNYTQMEKTAGVPKIHTFLLLADTRNTLQPQKRNKVTLGKKKLQFCVQIGQVIEQSTTFEKILQGKI